MLTGPSFSFSKYSFRSKMEFSHLDPTTKAFAQTLRSAPTGSKLTSRVNAYRHTATDISASDFTRTSSPTQRREPVKVHVKCFSKAEVEKSPMRAPAPV